jgi:hypothetical protein
MFMSVKLLQLLIVNPPIEVTLSGMVMSVKLLQSWNAALPIEVTLSGMFMLVMLLQRLNACDPIEVTLDGMFMLVKLSRNRNAISPIEVTVLPSSSSGISTSQYNCKVREVIQMVFQIRPNGKETENKTIRFPISLLERINNAIKNDNVSFSKFVIQACEYALDNMATTDKPRKKVKSRL